MLNIYYSSFSNSSSAPISPMGGSTFSHVSSHPQKSALATPPFAHLHRRFEQLPV